MIVSNFERIYGRPYQGRIPNESNLSLGNVYLSGLHTSNLISNGLLPADFGVMLYEELQKIVGWPGRVLPHDDTSIFQTRIIETEANYLKLLYEIFSSTAANMLPIVQGMAGMAVRSLNRRMWR